MVSWLHSLQNRQCHKLCTTGKTSKCWLGFRPICLWGSHLAIIGSNEKNVFYLQRPSDPFLWFTETHYSILQRGIIINRKPTKSQFTSNLVKIFFDAWNFFFDLFRLVFQIFGFRATLAWCERALIPTCNTLPSSAATNVRAMHTTP